MPFLLRWTLIPLLGVAVYAQSTAPKTSKLKRKQAEPAATAADVQALKDALAAQQQQIQQLQQSLVQRDLAVQAAQQQAQQAQAAAADAQKAAELAAHAGADKESVVRLNSDLADVKTTVQNGLLETQ